MISQPRKAAGFGEIFKLKLLLFFFFLENPSALQSFKMLFQMSRLLLRKSSGSYDQGQTGSS